MENTIENTTGQEQEQSPIPSISVPKGGGAISSIGEKFQVNALTGTAALSIPLPVSPARSGLAPSLSLNYDSGNGNGPFGWGWNLAIPHIRRKTAKGLPLYQDEEESDTFLFSGAEDLVPVLEEDLQGNWHPREAESEGYRVFRYRPRIEGAFSRIERWYHPGTGISYWKTITKNNVTHIYGQSRDTRVFDPEDETRVFQWLLEKTCDAGGNIVLYRYKRENSDNIDETLPFEGNRLKRQQCFNRLYPKSIHYGNKTAGNQDYFHFHILFDYGEHDLDNPALTETTPWNVRPDPFSSFLSGFEIRTWRLCRRILLFHEFAELGVEPVPVRSTDFSYLASETGTFLERIIRGGMKRSADGSRVDKAFPPVEFSYSPAELDTTVQPLTGDSLENLAGGVDGQRFQWVDLEGEGLPGIFTEQANGWFYKNNRGNGSFTPVRLLAEKPVPSFIDRTQPQLMDVDRDGSMELVLTASPLTGYFEQEDQHWVVFKHFTSWPRIDYSDPNLKYIDLNGDGLADILISEDEVFTWFPSKGKEGYDTPGYVRKALEEEDGPNLVFANREQSVYLADMTGDGLNDIVRVRNGEIVYWPNTGYGTFGARVLMDHAPVMDTPDRFAQRRIRLADIDGSGTTDLIYIGSGEVAAWFNRSGNSWSDPQTIAPFPLVDDLAAVSVTDLPGKGTACLVWSSALEKDREAPLRYIDLMKNGKPHLLTRINNNMGRETLFEYAPSTEFYLEDLEAGTPWITKLHFPVHVVKTITTIDHISSSRLVTNYKYHHGYYDAEEREFRGFGMVEQTDAESFDTYNPGNELDMAPVHTKTWFHTGAYVRQGVISRQYRQEYFDGDGQAYDFPDSVMENAAELDHTALREAYRALKSSLLRQEVYALDGSENQPVPYSVTENNYTVTQLQPHGHQKHAVYRVTPRETLSYAYERNSNDPRISHTVVLETDEFGQPLKSAAIAYPRRSSAAGVYAEQQRPYVTAQVNGYFNETDAFYLIGVPIQQKSFEIHGLFLETDGYFSFEDLSAQLDGVFEDAVVLAHHQPFTTGVQARLFNWAKNYYWQDESTPLPFGEVSPLALPHHTQQAVMSTDRVSEVFGTKVDDTVMAIAGYVQSDGHWWNPGIVVYYKDSTGFYLPWKTVDVFGSESKVTYGQYYLLPKESEDALGNTTHAEIDYRTLSPSKVTDINDNISEVLTDALGMVIAVSVYGTLEGEWEGDRPLSQYLEQTGITLTDVVADPAAYLQEASGFFYYNLDAWWKEGQPPYFINLQRETHVSELDEGEETAIQILLGYSDGFGRELQSKLKVDDGPLTETDTNIGERWLVSGRTVYNNKEKPVKQYEPFYSGTHAYQSEEEVAPVGVTPIIYYDPLGRVFKTETPKGFSSKVEFDPWQVSTYDENDTVKYSEYYTENQALMGTGNDEGDALEKAAAHYNTPSVTVLDSLGREFINMQYLEEGGDPLVTYTEFDIRGNPLTVTDPRQYTANQNRPAGDQVNNFRYSYDLVNNIFYTHSVDAGESWVLNNVLGSPVHTWNSRDFHIRTGYDPLQRPTRVFVEGSGLNHVVQRMEYGEGENRVYAVRKNLRGQLVRHYDQAGVVENHRFDIKGQLLSSTRTLRSDYKNEADWGDPALVDMESESFTTEMEYDASGRVVKHTKPDGSITRPRYHQAGWLKSVEVQLQKESSFTSFVDSIEYNAKGQRTSITYSSGVQTFYTYEAETFRLTSLKTVRPERNGSMTMLQDISYVYDPVGNIVKITDQSHDKVFTANQEVDAECTFVYDALYQLAEATGREHLGLSKTDYQQKSDSFKSTHFAHINDSKQLRSYTRSYTYDDSGNLTRIKHVGENPFTRDLTVSGTSNRAISDEMNTTVDVDSYFDAAGNLLELEHLRHIDWNYRNNIASVTVIERDSGNDSEYYVYDGSGQRVRKVKETYNSSGDLLWKEEKIYPGGVEIKRKRQGISETLTEERYALHVMDDQRRIAIVYYWTESNTSGITTEEHKIHYQLGNHLGSASLELETHGQLISYEEYFPYGGTAFTTGSSEKEVRMKEYRYTGKERDDTTGLYYYGARYYIPWGGRWCSADPAGMADGLNLYLYVSNSPITLLDPNGKAEMPSIELSLSKYEFELSEEDYITTADVELLKLKWDEVPTEHRSRYHELQKITGQQAYAQTEERILRDQQARKKFEAQGALFYATMGFQFLGPIRVGLGMLYNEDIESTAHAAKKLAWLGESFTMGAGGIKKYGIPEVEKSIEIDPPNTIRIESTHIGSRGKTVSNPINTLEQYHHCIACVTAYLASWQLEPIAPIADLSPGWRAKGWVTDVEIMAPSVGGPVGLLNRIGEPGFAAGYAESALNNLSAQGVLSGQFRLTTTGTAAWRLTEPTRTGKTDLYFIVAHYPEGPHALVGQVGTYEGRTVRFVFDPQRWEYVNQLPENISFFLLKTD